jgi:Cu(I)/Ag(I) efflux system membrane protein CusA/SilA
MAVVTTFIALVPILWSTGTGADVMRRIAAPMVGGLFTSFMGELIVFPALYFVWRGIGLKRTPLFEAKEEPGEEASEKEDNT